MDTMVSKLVKVIKGLSDVQVEELRGGLGWDIPTHIPKAKRSGYKPRKSNRDWWIRVVDQWVASEKGIKCFGGGKPCWIDKDNTGELNGQVVIIANKRDKENPMYAVCQHRVGSATDLGGIHFHNFEMLFHGTKFSELSEWMVANKSHVSFEVKS
tara:strand:- start:6559 stop:7023 length:465 start_codon:yes stop_codon:yes gene_type:complete